jgi:hypothetical protein
MKSSAENAKSKPFWIEVVSLLLASALLTVGVMVIQMVLSWLEAQTENWFGPLVFAGWFTILCVVQWVIPTASTGE